MTKWYLTPWQLQTMQENAEFGELDHTTVSKRHVRILTSLHFVLSTDDDQYTLPYANLATIQKLIERFFGKNYEVAQIRYWIGDLIKRNYVAAYSEDEDNPENGFFSLTESGSTLFALLSQRH